MNDALSRSGRLWQTKPRSNFFARSMPVLPALALAAAALFAFTSPAQAQVSPEGTWTFAVSGAARGNAVIEFFGDGSLNGVSIVVPPPGKSSSNGGTNPRGGSDDGRNGGGDSPAPDDSSGTTNFFGGADIEGSWTIDGTGALVGYLLELSQKIDEGATNGGAVNVTNAVSFRAIQRGDRMTLRAYSGQGKLLYKGQRDGTAPDLTGFYTAEGRADKVRFTEFISLSPSGIPNVYDVVGDGANYTVEGTAIVTSNGRLTILPVRSNGKFFSFLGKFNSRRSIGSLKGTGGGSSSGNATYRIVRQ